MIGALLLGGILFAISPFAGILTKAKEPIEMLQDLGREFSELDSEWDGIATDARRFRALDDEVILAEKQLASERDQISQDVALMKERQVSFNIAAGEYHRICFNVTPETVVQHDWCIATEAPLLVEREELLAAAHSLNARIRSFKEQEAGIKERKAALARLAQPLVARNKKWDIRISNWLQRARALLRGPSFAILRSRSELPYACEKIAGESYHPSIGELLAHGRLCLSSFQGITR